MFFRFKLFEKNIYETSDQRIAYVTSGKNSGDYQRAPCHMSNLYLVKSEYEVPDGYIDIILIPCRPWKPDYYALFELKYLKSGASERKIQEITEEGIGQLKRYSMSSEFSDVKNLKRWVLVFVGDRCVAIRDV